MTLKDFENAFALLNARRFSSNTSLTDAEKVEAEKILALPDIEKFAALLNTFAEELNIPADNLKNYIERAQNVLPVLETDASENLKRNLRDFLITLGQQDQLTDGQINQVTDMFAQWAKYSEGNNHNTDTQDEENLESSDSSDEEDEDKYKRTNDSFFPESFRPPSMLLVTPIPTFDKLIKKTNQIMQDSIRLFFETQKDTTSAFGLDINRGQQNSYSFKHSASSFLSGSPPKAHSSSKSGNSFSPVSVPKNGGTFLFEKQKINPTANASSLSLLLSPVTNNNGLVNNVADKTTGTPIVGFGFTSK